MTNMNRKIFNSLLAALLLLCVDFLTLSCSHKAPLIGVSSSFTGTSDKVSESYLTALRLAGGIPVILPRVSGEKEAMELIARLDGVFLTGGEDFQPALYGEEKLNETVKCVPARDTSDILLVRCALKQKKPIMGVCRGMQGINVALGGTLYQDIPTQFPGSCHKQKERGDTAVHSIALSEGSLVRLLLGGADSVRVNSLHHQAVKDPAPSLRITGWSEEGIPEALEGEGIIAVQFHPEKFIVRGDDFYLPLFEEFVCRAASRRYF